MLIKLHKIFGDKMKNHVAFVITRWSYGKKEILLRERRGMSEDLKTR